jgi:hypothetical protein
VVNSPAELVTLVSELLAIDAELLATPLTTVSQPYL